jgi:hypothetical protein
MYQARMPYFLVGIRGDADRAVGRLNKTGMQCLVAFDSTFGRTVSARLRAETAEQAEERVRGALKGEELTVGEAQRE